MKIDIDGQEIEISFMYPQQLTQPVDGYVWGRVTICVIKIGEQVSTAKASCSETDRFCYATGRRISLTRAVQKVLTRPQRYAFWSAYWDRRNEITKKKWKA